MNNGSMASKMGAKKFDASSNAGIKAKMRYSSVPIAIDTGKVHSLMKWMMLIFGTKITKKRS
jgi:hypothetical protein